MEELLRIMMDLVAFGRTTVSFLAAVAVALGNVAAFGDRRPALSSLQCLQS